MDLPGIFATFCVSVPDPVRLSEWSFGCITHRALDEHLSWETRAKQCKDLLSEMLKSRLEAAELTKLGYDLRPQPRRELPGGWWFRCAMGPWPVAN